MPLERIVWRGEVFNQRTIDMIEAAEQRMGGQLSIIQGSYSGAVSQSAGTHDGGGAVDCWPAQGLAMAEQAIAAMRAVGFAAWVRDPSQGDWNYHIHAIAIGDPDLSAGAAVQVDSYYGGGDGLAGSAGDYHPRPNPIPVWDGSYSGGGGGNPSVPSGAEAAPAGYLDSYNTLLPNDQWSGLPVLTDGSISLNPAFSIVHEDGYRTLSWQFTPTQTQAYMLSWAGARRTDLLPVEDHLEMAAIVGVYRRPTGGGTGGVSIPEVDYGDDYSTFRLEAGTNYLVRLTLYFIDYNLWDVADILIDVPLQVIGYDDTPTPGDLVEPDQTTTIKVTHDHATPLGGQWDVTTTFATGRTPSSPFRFGGGHGIASGWGPNIGTDHDPVPDQTLFDCFWNRARGGAVSYTNYPSRWERTAGQSCPVYPLQESGPGNNSIIPGASSGFHVHEYWNQVGANTGLAQTWFPGTRLNAHLIEHWAQDHVPNIARPTDSTLVDARSDGWWENGSTPSRPSGKVFFEIIDLKYQAIGGVRHVSSGGFSYDYVTERQAPSTVELYQQVVPESRTTMGPTRQFANGRWATSSSSGPQDLVATSDHLGTLHAGATGAWADLDLSGALAAEAASATPYGAGLEVFGVFPDALLDHPSAQMLANNYADENTPTTDIRIWSGQLYMAPIFEVTLRALPYRTAPTPAPLPTPFPVTWTAEEIDGEFDLSRRRFS